MSVRRAIVGFLVWYRRWVSPLYPATCRFHPSCSAYARDAVAMHGVWRGMGLTVWRLLRCQPFSRGGFDPVPATSAKRRRLAG